VVKAGDLLFQIDPRQFQAALDQARGDLARNEAALEKSRQDVARYGPLAAEGAVSQKELDDSVQAMRANQASVEAARAAVEQSRLNLEWTKVTAPIDGVAGIAVAQVGDLISPTAQLTTVSQLDPIKVYFPLSEQEYLSVADRIQQAESGLRQTTPLELLLADGSIYPHQGRFSAADRQVDVRTGTIQIQTLFPNPKNILRPGQFARVRARTAVRPNAIVVPQRAVQDLQGQYQVIVVGDDGKAQIRNVTVGDRVGSDWVISSGLEHGDRVVVEGQQKVRAGAQVKAEPFVPPATPVRAAS
jgi:membrane fusion protein (multidrug efflux system)